MSFVLQCVMLQSGQLVQVCRYQSVRTYNTTVFTGSGAKSAARSVEVPSGVLPLGFDTCRQTEITETENGRILSNEVTVAEYYSRSRTEVF
jgi:hypothetical protein